MGLRPLKCRLRVLSYKAEQKHVASMPTENENGARLGLGAGSFVLLPPGVLRQI
jgi:hypothetical protein